MSTATPRLSLDEHNRRLDRARDNPRWFSQKKARDHLAKRIRTADLSPGTTLEEMDELATRVLSASGRVYEEQRPNGELRSALVAKIDGEEGMVVIDSSGRRHTVHIRRHALRSYVVEVGPRDGSSTKS